MSMNTEQRILCLAARTRIDPRDEECLLQLLRTPPDWEHLWAQAHRHDVLPLLTATLRRLRSQAHIPTDWMVRAERRLCATLLHNSVLVEELLRILAAFQEAGIAAMPVKGIVLAETLYGNLALRPAADLDVLARPADLPAARSVLDVLGFAQKIRSNRRKPHPYHDPQYFRDTGRGAVCLELHWALCDPRLFRLDHDRLWERAVVTRLCGTDMRILSPEDTLLHLAIHRAGAPLRLRFTCDIAELLWRQRDALDWDYLLQQARDAGARTALFSALALAHELLGAPLVPTVLPRLGIGHLKRWLLNYTFGAHALFHPAAAGDLDQWAYAPLRPLLLDDLGPIARGLSIRLTRRAWRQLASYPRRWRLAKAARQ